MTEGEFRVRGGYASVTVRRSSHVRVIRIVIRIVRLLQPH